MTTFEELYDKPCEPRLLASQFPDQLMAEEMSLIQKILFSYTLKKKTLPYLTWKHLCRYINILLPVTQLMSGGTGIIRH